MMERALIEYIANTLWQIPLLAGGAWLLLWIVRPRPQLQYGVWLTVLGLAVLLPMHGMVKPEVAVTPLQRVNKLPAIASLHYATVFPQRPPQTRRIRLGETSTRWLVRLYLATIAFGLYRIVHSWLAARHLVSRSRAICLDEENKRSFERYGQRLNISLPEVRESDEVTSPMILGATQPILLLPQGFGRFTASEVTAALCHELAHVKRRDYLGNLFCQLVALPIAWHPLMTVVQQRIRMTREMVCDAMAAREMESPLRYAKSLLALAHGLLGGLEIAEQAQFPGLFGNNRLEERVTRLMDTTTVCVRTRLTRMLGGAVVTLATVSVAAIFHVTPTMAEPQPAASPQLAQIAPVVTEAQPTEAAPEPEAPVVPMERSRMIAGKRASKTAAQACKQKEAKQQVEEMRQQTLRMKAMFDGPVFKRQMDEATQQTLQAQTMLNTSEFNRQMDDAQRHAALQAQIMINSPEFKRQMDEARQQALQAQTMLNSSEFKRQMDDAQRQAALKAQTMINSREFKRQMDEVRQQALQAQTMIDSPEFKRQMSEAQTMVKRQMEDMARGLAEAARELNESSEGGQTK